MTPSKIHDPGRPLATRLRGLGALLAAALALAAAPAGLHAQATATQAPPPYDLSLAVHRPVLAPHGMVVSEQHLATRVGVDILQRGGNAVDAAVAVGFALAVVLPNAGNLGGGGFMVIHDAKAGRQVALDFREVAPAGASRDMYLDAGGQVVPNRSLYTPLAVGVPGSVAGLLHALDRWGTLPRRTVMAPAIRLAREGFVVSEELAAGLKANEKTMGAWAATRAVFFRDGRPVREGERLVQRDLARSLERIAREGAGAFYRGEIARHIAADMAEFGGLVTRADLAAYQPVEREPVQGSYRGLRVVSMPPRAPAVPT